MPDFLARFADATNPKTGALAFSNGSIDRARGIIARSYGTSEGHSNVQRELREIKEKLDVERAGGGKHPWYGIFTGLRTAYRTLLGRVNFGTAFPSLYTVERFGRRPFLITTIGYVMIVFACLFIAGFAMTWRPIVWALVTTTFNWVWNFLISFFTPYITSTIDYRYGYIFAACCSMGATLEEIDTMYILGVNPIKSKHWQPPEGEDLPSLDNTYLTLGARGIKKNEAGVPTEERRESTGPRSGDIFQAPGA
ncbi:uncharacterized protein K441DRAFT_709701 [Cenococcum geophilum 1.58]|uniref:Uncharacterized protein n=1 Tax=Cenococcum geophilum 1.58 TaxID=794803 RepID=A0ACC8EKZ8_9PEZI|nr:hypothetical protein K441DRAFT_709701 [Cenococcum geophilum 1.58]